MLLDHLVTRNRLVGIGGTGLRRRPAPSWRLETARLLRIFVLALGLLLLAGMSAWIVLTIL
jgi:hypothetical protein